ncbi:hypothetical protein T484DRAFT_1750268 [Baffinella frigidus]|nr:hypothetical protein T484DRAFT_1750268 [Cryptophyta sp. CCMP2293]
MFQLPPFYNPAAMLLPLLPPFVLPLLQAPSVGNKRPRLQVEDTIVSLQDERPRSAPRVTFAPHASSRDYQYEVDEKPPACLHDDSEDGGHRTSDEVEQEAAAQSPQPQRVESEELPVELSVVTEYHDQAEPATLYDGPSEEVLVLGRLVHAALSTGCLVKSNKLILALVEANRRDLVEGMHARLLEVIARLSRPESTRLSIRVAPNKAINVPRASLLQMGSLAAIAAAFLPGPSPPTCTPALPTWRDNSPRAAPECSQCGTQPLLLIRALPEAGSSTCATCTAL